MKFCFDQNMGSMPTLLRQASAHSHERITDFDELGIPPNAKDEDWLRMLGSMGRFAVITRDGQILQAALRRRVWRDSKITLFLLDKRWGKLPLRDLFRGLIFWWPAIVERAGTAPEGTAWTVKSVLPKWNESGIRLVRPPDDAE